MKSVSSYRKIYGLILLFLTCFLTFSCGSSTDDNDDEATVITGTDIKDAVLTKSDESCSSYAGTYSATVKDIAKGTDFNSWIMITKENEKCSFKSNSIPNHDFNDASASFANTVKEVTETFSMTTTPTKATSSTSLSLQYDNGIFLNGIKLDLLAAACYGVGDEPLGKEKIGCFEEGKAWRYDPMFSGNSFGTDAHNAHTQPDGAYHYHGSPKAMYDTTGAAASAVIGFAADGFPIFGPFIDDNGTIRAVVSGYTLKSGARTNISGEGAFPGGNYDGTYIDDYAFTDVGDLDECNGMTRNGFYAYYVTNTYPWVIGCFKGALDSSFKKSSAGGPPGR